MTVVVGDADGAAKLARTTVTGKSVRGRAYAALTMLVQAFDHGAFDVEPVESDPADDTPASTILYGEVEPFSAHSTVTTVVTPKTAQEWLGRIPGGYVQSFDVGAFDRSFITSQSRHVTVIPACRRGPSRQRRTVRRSTRTRAPASRRSSDPDLADRARVAGAAR